MNMKMELTPKDIRLLKVAFVILLVVVMGRFLILPQIERREDLSLELEEATAKADEMQMEIDRIPSLKNSLEEGRKNLKELASPYYSIMENRNLDEHVTGLALAHSLFPDSLAIDAPIPGIPALYAYTGTADADPAAKQDEYLESPGAYLQVATVSLSVRGPESNIRALLDDIEKNEPSIQVRSFTMQDRTYLNSSLAAVDEKEASLVLAVYMCTDLQTNP